MPRCRYTSCHPCACNSRPQTIYETLEDDPDEPLLMVVNPACTEVLQPDACMIVYRFKESAFPWSGEAVKLVLEEKEFNHELL